MNSTEIEIADVRYAAMEGGLQGFFRAEARADRLRIFGWAFARDDLVSVIEVHAAGEVVATAKTGISRPDVGDRFEDVAAAADSGFDVTVEADGEGRSELEVEAVVASGDRHPLGTIAVSATAGRASGELRQAQGT